MNSRSTSIRILFRKYALYTASPRIFFFHVAQEYSVSHLVDSCVEQVISSSFLVIYSSFTYFSGMKLEASWHDVSLPSFRRLCCFDLTALKPLSAAPAKCFMKKWGNQKAGLLCMPFVSFINLKANWELIIWIKSNSHISVISFVCSFRLLAK